MEDRIVKLHLSCCLSYTWNVRSWHG